MLSMQDPGAKQTHMVFILSEFSRLHHLILFPVGTLKICKISSRTFLNWNLSLLLSFASLSLLSLLSWNLNSIEGTACCFFSFRLCTFSFLVGGC